MDHSDLLNYDPAIWEKAVYGVTSVLAVFSNLVLCVIIVKEKNSISDKSDILFMLNISVASLLTGMRIIIRIHTFPRKKVTSYIHIFLL